jgi:urea carboxylase-associated protein 2
MTMTADPKGARAHARAMAGTRVPCMPTVPAAASADPPPGVAAADLLWEETLAGGGYAARELRRGARLRIIDLAGDACVSLLLFNAERPIERLNVADTIKLQWQAYLGTGSLLLSDMGRALASIVEDSAGTHDVFAGTSNATTNAQRYGDGSNSGPHPNGRDRLVLGAGKLGLARHDVHPCVNLFKGVRVGADGALGLQAGPFAPLRQVTLRCEMNLFVVLANCPHVLDPRPQYTVTPARVTAWRGPPAAADDPLRLRSLESERAFLNVDDYFNR